MAHNSQIYAKIHFFNICKNIVKSLIATKLQNILLRFLYCHYCVNTDSNNTKCAHYNLSNGLITFLTLLFVTSV